jgi:hypothetical protein
MTDTMKGPGLMKRELRCEQHKHGQLNDDELVVKCHQCSKRRGEPVYHRWDVRTGQRLDHEDHDAAAAEREHLPAA